MARLSFRQGIVRHQTDTNNNPTFLQKVGDYVNLVVSPSPTIVTFVHGNKNYLFTESVTIIDAWGPLPPGSDVWLYLDLNMITGVRTFSHTAAEPTEAGMAPMLPIVNQMWFNTTINKWHTWSGSSWSEVIRVFVAKYANSTTFVSMSGSAPSFVGTQVGLNVDNTVGAITFDATGAPIRDGSKHFFTTEDKFVTGVPTGASLKVNNIILRGQAEQPIGAYGVVVYSNYNKIIPAAPFSVLNRVYGITEEGANIGDVVNVVTEGTIYNHLWDWEAAGALINDPVYLGLSGQLQLSATAVDVLPVGAVIGPQTILFDPTLYGLSSGSGPTIGGDDLTTITNATAISVKQFGDGGVNDVSHWQGLTPTDLTLDTLHDTSAGTPSDGNILRWNATTVLWEASNPSYDIHMAHSGVVVVGDTIGRHITSRMITLGDDTNPNTGQYFANTPPVGTAATFDVYMTTTSIVQLIGATPVLIGTITFNPGEHAGDLNIITQPFVLPPGGHVYIIATANNGIADVTFTIAGYEGI